MHVVFDIKGKLCVTLHQDRVRYRPSSYEQDILNQMSSVFFGIEVTDPKDCIKTPLNKATETAEVFFPSPKDYIIGRKTLEKLFSSVGNRKGLVALLNKHNIENIWISKGNLQDNIFSDVALLKWNKDGENFQIERTFSENAFTLDFNDSFHVYFAQTSKPKSDELQVLIQSPQTTNAAAVLQARTNLNAEEVKELIIKAISTNLTNLPTSKEIERINFSKEQAIELIEALSANVRVSKSLFEHLQFLGSNRSIREAFIADISKYRNWLKLNMSTSYFAVGLTASADPRLIKALELTFSESEARDTRLRKDAEVRKVTPKESDEHPAPTNTRLQTAPRIESQRTIQPAQASPSRISLQAPATPTRSAAVAPSRNGDHKPTAPSEDPQPHRGKPSLFERLTGEELLKHIFTNDPALYDALRRAMSEQYANNEKMVFFGQRSDVLGPRKSQERLNWAKANPNYCFAQGLGLNKKVVDDKIVDKEYRLTLNTWANEDENRDTKFAISLRRLFAENPGSIKVATPISKPPDIPAPPPAPTPHKASEEATSHPTHRGKTHLLDRSTGEELLSHAFSNPPTFYDSLRRAMSDEYQDNEKIVFFGQRKDIIGPRSSSERLDWAKENPNHCFSQGLGLNKQLLEDRILSKENRIALNTWANEDKNRDTKFAISLRSLFSENPESVRVIEITQEDSHKQNGKVPTESIPVVQDTNFDELANFVSSLVDSSNVVNVIEWIETHPKHPFSLSILNDERFARMPLPRPLAERLLSVRTGA